MLIMNMVLGEVVAKEVTAIDKFVNFFDKFDPVTTAFLAALNLILVFIVFRFTRKMSQSKLSVSPETAYSTRIRLDEMMNHHPDLKHDKEYFKEIQFKEEGFPLTNQQSLSETLFLRVKNRGDLPSTNIKIQLSFKIYKTKIKYDKRDSNDLNIRSQNRKKHKTIIYNINIPYMGADEERLYDLFELHGQFRETELILLKIKANGHVYFREKIMSYLFNPTIINHYKHPLLDSLGDLDDGKMFLGHKQMWENLRETERLEAEEWEPIEFEHEEIDSRQNTAETVFIFVKIRNLLSFGKVQK